MQTAAAVYLPRVPLAAAIGLLFLVVAGVGLARLNGMEVTPGLGQALTVPSRLISFEQLAGGALQARDATTGEIIVTSQAGEAGFLHGSMRGLMFNRKRGGIPLTAPFKLESRANGQIVLTDLSDGTAMELNAFGRGNALEFKALLGSGNGVTP